MRYITLFLLTLCLLYAGKKDDITVRILEKVFVEVAHKKEVVIWADTPRLIDLIKASGLLRYDHDCRRADILLIDRSSIIPTSCKNTVHFATDYHTLVEHHDAVGAFFWQKGRPNIIFLRHSLERLGIVLSHEYEKYIENEL